MKLLRGKGKIEIDNGVRIITRVDICKYYRWLIQKAKWDTISPQIPKHKGHITIINPKIHGENLDYSKIECFRNMTVNFFYDPEDMYESRVNFWIPVQCDEEKQIKWLMRVEDEPDYWGLHLTVCNVKFNNNKNEQ